MLPLRYQLDGGKGKGYTLTKHDSDNLLHSSLYGTIFRQCKRQNGKAGSKNGAYGNREKTKGAEPEAKDIVWSVVLNI